MADYASKYLFQGDAASLAPTTAEPATFFVRALYDYQSTDASSLTFRKGDLIEVLTQLDSGWWDGLLEDERGWFPSNYVVPISDDEVEQEFRAKGYYQDRPEDGLASLQASIDGSHTDEGSWPSNGNVDMLDKTISTSSSSIPRSASMQSTLFWVPRMSQSGHIYYVNSETGEESNELPSMAEDAAEEDADGYMGGRPSARVSRAPRAELLNSYEQLISGPKDGILSSNQRVRTPDPWIRRMTDDGMAYYYWNPASQQVRWTPPSPVPDIPADGHNQPYINGIARRDTVSSVVSEYAGLYEDGPFYTGPLTDVPDSFSGALNYTNGFDLGTGRPPPPSNSSGHSVYSGSRKPRAIRRLPDAPLAGPRIALEYAAELQTSMEHQEELALIQDYAAYARDVIEVVIDTATQIMDESPTFPRDGIDFIREKRLEGQNEDDQPHPQLSGRVAQAATAVLNLLLASGKLLPPVEEGDLAGDSATLDYIKSMSADPLTSFHRKVAANLSRLVLSSRAADSVPDARPPEMAATLERDARELERSVVTFVLELEKLAEPVKLRQVKAVLSPGKGVAGVGTGIIGGGLGAGWKANGFVALESGEDAFPRAPDTETVKELNDLSIAVDDHLTKLSELISMAYSRQYQSRSGSPTDPYLERGDPIVAEGSSEDTPAGIPREVVAQVISQCRAVIQHLTAFLHYAESVDLASHLDFDGGVGNATMKFKSSVSADDYEASVRQARMLVRTFEITKQSLYDEGALLLMAAQTTSASTPANWTNALDQSPLHVILTALSSLKSHTTEIMETIESLSEVATAQAESAQSGRRGRIGLRSPNYRESSDATLGAASRMMGAFATSQAPYAHFMTEQDDDPEVSFEDAVHPFGAAGGNLGGHRTKGGLQGLQRDQASNDEVIRDVVNEPARTRPYSDSPLLGAVEDSADAEWATTLVDEDDIEDEDGEANVNNASRRERKLRNLLGPDAPVAAQTTLEVHAHMKPIYGPPDIVLHDDGGVRGGILPALVEHLTMHNALDSTFNETFLMTFKSFATADEVVTELIARFNLPPPEGLTPAEFKEWKDDKQKRYRFRTMNVLKALIQSQTLDSGDLNILNTIKEFADGIQEPDMTAPKMQVLQSIKMRTDEAQAKKYTSNGLQDPPASILPKNLKKFKLNELDPIELARQLTIMESRLFNRVRPTECLARGRDKPATALSEDNITGIIAMSNQLAQWVTDAVLAKDEVKKRAGVIRYFISVAEQCKRLKNFSSMAALIAGLNTPPVRRLRRSWEQVHQRANAVLADLEKTIDSGRNFSEYRRLLTTIDPPCVPFFGLYLRDLTFIQDGNNNFLSVPGKKVINFDKRQRASQIIREIQRYQAATYDLSPVDAIIEFVEQSMTTAGTQTTDYWNLSLEREPREREEERMARLLQESGFL